MVSFTCIAGSTFYTINPDWLQKFFIWFESFKILPHQYTDTMPEETSAFFQYSTKGWINDLGIAASRKTPSAIWLILFILVGYWHYYN